MTTWIAVYTSLTSHGLLFVHNGSQWLYVKRFTYLFTLPRCGWLYHYPELPANTSSTPLDNVFDSGSDSVTGARLTPADDQTSISACVTQIHVFVPLPASSLTTLHYDHLRALGSSLQRNLQSQVQRRPRCWTPQYNPPQSPRTWSKRSCGGGL